ncbi:MAG: HAMP domain-containing protein [Vicinamibacteraceae bacterium]|nr:HAMP domain-containing protein [Vicinamibacteraceae bacterium]
MRLLGSLSNRIFLTTTLLAMLSIGMAVWLISRTLTAQLEQEAVRSLAEAGTLVDEYRRVSLAQLGQSARLIADLPKFKAAVELNHPPTMAPLAAGYRRQLDADLLIVAGRDGRLLASDVRPGLLPLTGAEREGLAVTDALRGIETAAFLPRESAILQLVTVPVWIDPGAPDLLGALVVGVALDARFAGGIKALTASDIALAWDGRVRATTLEGLHEEALAPLLASGGSGPAQIGHEAYDAVVRPLVLPPSPQGGVAAVPPGTGAVVVLRSRTERLRPLRALHAALAATALLVVLLATLLSYLVARTVTRPVGAITAAMREMAASGDLASQAPLTPGSRWVDDDARVLADTFNAMTASIARFQREAAQRDRLSSLGRLSTVIAHEIRNPLMIIRTALRTLRRSEGHPTAVAAAAADIDEEVHRLNRVVNEVLDFARPITFDVAPASLSAICREALAAAEADGLGLVCRVVLDPDADAVVTDAERVRQALVNVLLNARQAVAARVPIAGGGDVPPAIEEGRAPRIELETIAGPGRVRITVRDEGPGVDAATLSRMFEPFFTSRPSGTGIGLAITRNIVEGLGGTVRAASRPGEGTDVTIELPRAAHPPRGLAR